MRLLLCKWKNNLLSIYNTVPVESKCIGLTLWYSVYSLFSALIMHVYQMRSSVPSIVATCQERINICMQALKDVSKVWLVAKMVHMLFESILGNKILEERLQKAAGKRHQKMRHEHQGPSSKRPNEAPKRKFDDMDIGLPNGGPTPPVSYERSRPQTPAVTPSRELGQPTSISAQQASPTAHRTHQDAAPGAANSRTNTRPTTPFNTHFPLPATPPDLFLVTRTSPNLSPSLWENFQPDQLFPEGSAMFPELSSTPPNTVDPQLQMPTQLPTQSMPQRPMVLNQSQQLPARTLPGSQESPEFLLSGLPQHDMSLHNSQQQHQQQQHAFGSENNHGWPMQGVDTSLGGAAPDAASQDDSWSSSSRGAPTAPTTLNVEDWYVTCLFSFRFSSCEN